MNGQGAKPGGAQAGCGRKSTDGEIRYIASTVRSEAAADPDNNGTISKDEYRAVVERQFKAADPDNDGTLSGQELKTKAGRSLLQLLR